MWSIENYSLFFHTCLRRLFNTKESKKKNPRHDHDNKELLVTAANRYFFPLRVDIQTFKYITVITLFFDNQYHLKVQLN